ncbi:MAG: sigma-70 family RNA polymerase sigma factor [Oscillospiraceae bacterium]|jgi:RNA polymerase sigma factor (sigma-70 family)|nr:sigma-70 family RNA polymerase sigma factor [Oscillospiraceae bacterium]
MDRINLAETVESAQNGDETAIEMLYVKYAKQVYYLALKIMRNSEDAEDITSEVFITVCEKIGELKEPNTFPRWLNRITANKCTDFFRKRGNVVKEEFMNEEEFTEEPDPLLVPDKAFDSVETAQMIVDIIDTLPDPQRICVYYYYYEQLTIAQIAEILATNENAVKGRLHLARGKIRKELERLNREDGIKLYSAVPLMLTPALKLALQNFEMPAELVHGLWRKIAAAVAGNAVAGNASAAGWVATVLKAKIIPAIGGILLAVGTATGVFIAANSDNHHSESGSGYSETIIFTTSAVQAETEISEIAASDMQSEAGDSNAQSETVTSDAQSETEVSNAQSETEVSNAQSETADSKTQPIMATTVRKTAVTSKSTTVSVQKTAANTMASQIVNNGISAKNIANIYVCHMAMQLIYLEYLVDLENGRHWRFSPSDRTPYNPDAVRDKNAANGGYDLVCDLTEDKIAAFCAEADSFGFTSWNASYIDPSIADGHSWDVTITFLDGSVKNISGSNKYPDTWEDMGGAFWRLTGVNKVF